MSGLIVLWVLALLVAYPARTHLRRAALGFGRAAERALRFVGLALLKLLEVVLHGLGHAVGPLTEHFDNVRQPNGLLLQENVAEATDCQNMDYLPLNLVLVFQQQLLGVVVLLFDDFAHSLVNLPVRFIGVRLLEASLAAHGPVAD